MKIVFMGTPDFAVPVLDALVAAGHEVVAAYTQPPRPGGRRGRELVASPVQARAEALGIPVRSPVSLRGAEEQAGFASFGAEVGVVAAYGLILPRAVLDAPGHGCLNVHASLLPRWRGAAPIHRAILAGDAETGVTIMQMEAGLDTGPVRLKARTSVATKTAGELTAELSQMGARAMVELLADLAAYPPVPQPGEGVTYASKVEKGELRLDFTQDAAVVERQVRAFNPPGAWVEAAGERVRVLEAMVLPAFPGEGRGPATVNDGSAVGQPASDLNSGLRQGTSGQPGLVIDYHLTIACAGGAVRPTLVQRAGRAVTTTAELLRGFPIPPGTQLA